jgi:ribosomal protein L14E/L6E/L27E
MSCKEYIQIRPSTPKKVKEIQTEYMNEITLNHLNSLSKTINSKKLNFIHRAKKANRVLEYLTIPADTQNMTPFKFYKISNIPKQVYVHKKADEELIQSNNIETGTQDSLDNPEPPIQSPFENKSGKAVNMPFSESEIHPPDEPLYILEDNIAYSRTKWIVEAQQHRAKSLQSLCFYRQCIQ